MLTSGFFNSVGHDRRYDAEQMSSIFDGIIRDGIFMSIGKQMRVTAHSDWEVVVETGRAWFDHTWTLNTALYPLDISNAHLLYDRVDAVVLEVNHEPRHRQNYLKVIKGPEDGSGDKPVLKHTDMVNQYPLAYISVAKRASKVTQGNITSTIGTTECPYVTGILETITFDDLIVQWKAQWEEMLDDKDEDWDRWLAENDHEFDEFLQATENTWDNWFQQSMSDWSEFRFTSQYEWNVFFESVKAEWTESVTMKIWREIQALQGRATELEQDVIRIDGDISDLETDLGDLEKKHDDDVDDILKKIKALNDQLNAVKQTFETQIQNIQNDIDQLTNDLEAKQDKITGAATTITDNNLTPSRALISNSNGKVAVSPTVTDTELGYLDGVTSNVQTQFDKIVAGIEFSASAIGWYPLMKVNTDGSYASCVLNIYRTFNHTNNEYHKLLILHPYHSCSFEDMGSKSNAQIVTKIRCVKNSSPDSIRIDIYYNATVLNTIRFSIERMVAKGNTLGGSWSETENHSLISSLASGETVEAEFTIPANNILYGTGNKPSASDVGALPSTTKYAGSDTTGGTANKSYYIVEKDTRSDNSPPSFYMALGKGIHTEFKKEATIGLTATGNGFCELTTFVQWSDQSGDRCSQIATGGPEVYYRTAKDDSTWNDWKYLISTNNLATTLNSMINALSIVTTTPTDADYYISQYANGGTTTTTYHRRTHSELFNYMLSKFLIKGTLHSAIGTTPDSTGTYPGIYYVKGTSGIYNYSDGALYQHYYNSDWLHQIYGEYRTGQIAIRGKNNGTWQAWRKVLDSANYTGYTNRGWRTSKSGIKAAGWYRIAQTGAGIGNDLGIFVVNANASSYHSSVIFTVGISYGYTEGIIINQIACSRYSNFNITKARIVYHTAYSNNYAYVEVYVSTSASTAIIADFIGVGWDAVTPVAGSIPSGYSNKEITFSVGGVDIAGAVGTLPVAHGGTGKTTGGDAANYFMNALTTGDSVPVDNDYYISQYVNGGTTTTTYHRRPVSRLYSYIFNKMPAFTKSGSGAAKGLVPAPSTTAGTSKYLREDGTWAVPPNTNTTYSDMTGATASAAGTHGLVPAPAAGKQASFLRGDGTWAVPTNTTYSDMTGATSSAAGTHGLAPAPSAGDTSRALLANATWGYPALISGIYTGNGGAQAPSYIPGGRTRFNMMNAFKGLTNPAGGYMDTILMDNYTGGDVPYVTGLGITKNNGVPRMFIANGAKNNATTWAHQTEVITENNLKSKFTSSGVSRVGKDMYIAYPEGGTLNSSVGSSTGYLRITLPVAFVNTMMKFTVSIFNYLEGTSVDYIVGGYNFSSDSSWYNCTAIAIGKYNASHSNLTVRFGTLNNKAAVSIGDSGTKWAYAQVVVHDIICGYQNGTYANFSGSWTIDISTSAVGGFLTTVTNTGVNRIPNFVKSGSSAASGLVPAPSTTAGTTKYLREDGTWATPPNTTYSVASTTANGLMSKEDKAKLEELGATVVQNSSKVFIVKFGPLYWVRVQFALIGEISIGLPTPCWDNTYKNILVDISNSNKFCYGVLKFNSNKSITEYYYPTHCGGATSPPNNTTYVGDMFWIAT